MKLGTYGSICLIVTLIITKALISSPALYIQQSMSAGWLEVLISGLFELFVLFIVLRLVLRFDRKDIIDISYTTFGKPGRIIVGILSCFVILVNSAAVCRSFAELIRNTVIRGHSYEGIIFFILAGSLVAGYFGIRTQINLNGMILPVIIIAILVIAFINIAGYSFSNIQPILGNGFNNTVSNALLKNASFFEVGIFLFLIPYLGNGNDVKQICFTSLVVSIIVISGITLVYQLSVPYEAAQTFAIPLYQMTRMLKAGEFFQRIEPLNVFIWGGAMFVYVGIGVWLTAHVFKKTFNLQNEKPMIYIFSVIIGITALIPGSETSVEKIYSFLMIYSYVAYPLLPLIFLIVASLLKEKFERKDLL